MSIRFKLVGKRLISLEIKKILSTFKISLSKLQEEMIVKRLSLSSIVTMSFANILLNDFEQWVQALWVLFKL